MKAKVRNYKFISDCFDSLRGTYLKKEDTTRLGQVNIVFDENMYIEYPSDFETELFNITENCIQKVINQNILYEIESKLNLLLEKYRNMKLLFLESDLFFKQKEGMIILHGEKYFNEY